MNLDVSVVIPCFNAEKTVLRSLNSIVDQTFKPKEVIVVDDGSFVPVDESIKIWSADKEILIKVITQSNRGAPAARNVGVEYSKSRYVAFLDADDIWHPKKLEVQYKAMRVADLSICGHGYKFEIDDMSIFNRSLISEEVSIKKISKINFAFSNPLFTPTVMILKSAFSGFDERFKRVDDYKAWVENVRPGKCGVISSVLAAGFKPAIGHSGLTGSTSLMHEAYLEVLFSLLFEGKISSTFYSIARFVEFIKYPIRRYRVKKNYYRP